MPQETIRVSPAGELMWARVLAPGLANQGKPDEREEYSIDLLLAKADAQAQDWVTELKQLVVAAHGTAARPGPNGLPYKTYLNDQGDETDLWKFTFKRGTETRRGNPLPAPSVEDAKGNPWPKDVLIGNGSAGKVACRPYTWSNPEGGKGISLSLEAVRILHLVPYEPPNAAAAFGEPEEGYVLTGDEPRVNLVEPKDDLPSTEEVPW